MLMRCLKTLCVGAVVGAASLLAGAAHAEGWEPPYPYALYVRNNSKSTFTGWIGNSKLAANCSASEYKYRSGYLFTIAPGSTATLLSIGPEVPQDIPDCTTLDTAWAITLTQSGYAGKTRYFSQGSFYSGSYASTEGAASQTIGTETVTYYSRKYLHESGSYITIGDDYFGKLGPSQTSEYSNTLTVTSFNTYMRQDTYPEVCERGRNYQKVLASIDTDVLMLQEVNASDDDCDYDAHELINYLWQGPDSTVSIRTDSYAKGDNGTGISLKGSGEFPYVSQMSVGIAANGVETATGGAIILSKYPLEMVANEKFSTLVESSGDKGFIVVRITKNGKTYFLINTHPQAAKSKENIRRAQLADIGNWISENSAMLAGHRVILGGDLNTGLDADAKDATGVNSEFTYYDPESLGSYSGDAIMSAQTNTAYYGFSRDNSKNFYENDIAGTTPREVMNIDWIIPILKSIETVGISFTTPSSYKWWVHPVRYAPFKFAELSDHFAVSGTFFYSTNRTFSWTLTGSVTEDTTTPAKGTIKVSDNTPLAAQTVSTNYGKFVLTPGNTGGSWTYTIDNTKTAVQALGAGKTATDTFTVSTVDGENSTNVTITIKGVNDPATFSGPTTGWSVTEDGTRFVTGKLFVSDVDAGESSFRQAKTVSSYGVFWTYTDGVWSYQFASHLPEGTSLTEKMRMESYDGTDAWMTITIANQ